MRKQYSTEICLWCPTIQGGILAIQTISCACVRVYCRYPQTSELLLVTFRVQIDLDNTRHFKVIFLCPVLQSTPHGKLKARNSTVKSFSIVALLTDNSFSWEAILCFGIPGLYPVSNHCKMSPRGRETKLFPLKKCCYRQREERGKRGNGSHEDITIYDQSKQTYEI